MRHVGRLRDAATEAESLNANSTKDEAQTALDNRSSAVAGERERRRSQLGQCHGAEERHGRREERGGNGLGDATLADAAAAVKAAGTSMRRRRWPGGVRPSPHT